MGSPIETIKQGIEAADWKKVVQGYNRLTGCKLRAPEAGGPPPGEVARPLRDAIAEAIVLLRDAIDGREEVAPADDDGRQEEDEEEAPDPESEPEPGPGPEPEGPTEEERVRHAREVAAGRASPDFTHVHDGTPTNNEGGRLCRREPFRKGMKNTFVDDGRLHKADAKTDRKLTRGLSPSERRPAAKKVKVRCNHCGKDFTVDPSLAPRTIQGDNGEVEGTHFVCDGCHKRGR